MSGAFRHDDACDCDVLVVGGGLVGLAASMFLAQKGLRVWVVERHASTSNHPKFRGVSACTMELYGCTAVNIEQNESTVTANVGADGRT